MLIINIELWPAGDQSRAELIGWAAISNITNLADISDYDYHLEQKGSRFAGPLSVAGKILAHERKKGPWALVARMLAQALPAQAKSEGEP